MMCVSRFVVGWNGDVECGSMVHALGSFAERKVLHDGGDLDGEDEYCCGENENNKDLTCARVSRDFSRAKAHEKSSLCKQANGMNLA